ncbi:MAG: GyrI-like domain-containing protein [Anaerolineaceae bacterium]
MSPLTVRSHYRAQYLNRIEKSLQYIERNLSGQLDLEIVARESSFSPFHFHRLFSALLNESPQEYINRQRLERAANLLVKSPSLSMTEVACQTGFSTSSNFARSFKKHFGCTASDYARRHRKSNQPYSWISLEAPVPPSPVFKLPEVFIRTMPALHLAYFNSKRGYETSGVKEAWLNLFNWASSRKIDFHEQKLIAISFDDPEITPPAKCRYLACLTIPVEIRTDSRANLMDIQETLCAVCRLSCDVQEFPLAYRALYRDWLPDSGFMLADLPPYEIVYNAPDVDPNSKYVFDLCIPVEPL